jgi:glutathione S-transferase
MILHHYEVSPFSEKIRLMFGYCGMQWQSVISPAMPPRSIVDPLAGGYRRMPVMQIGADIFCDTQLIASELATACDKPELALESCANEIANYSQHVDTTIFTAGVQTSSPLQMLAAVFTLFTPMQGLKFIKDRARVQQASSIQPLGRAGAKKIINQHYENMESMLVESTFLFGDRPSVADFSAYHNLWFKHLTGKTKQLDGHPLVNAWFNKMSTIGHGQRSELSKREAFNTAKKQEPRSIPDCMKASGQRRQKVEIKPTDYAKDSVIGLLIAEDDSRWIIARETAEFGRLHVHFPKQGFEMTACKD